MFKKKRYTNGEMKKKKRLKFKYSLELVNYNITMLVY